MEALLCKAAYEGDLEGARSLIENNGVDFNFIEPTQVNAAFLIISIFMTV